MALSSFSGGCQLMRSLCRTAPVTCLGYQQQRSIVKLRRLHPTLVPKFGGKPHRMKTKHHVYVWEGDSMQESRSKMQLILTENVAKIGNRGDVVSVTKAVGRNNLLRQNLAVYASPENIKEFALEKKEKEEKGVKEELTPTALKTVEFLQKHRLTVKVRSFPEWDVLPREAVLHAFDRNLGVVVPDYALQMPEEPVTDYGEYTVKVTVNKVETVAMQMAVVHYVNKARAKTLRAQQQSPTAET